MIIVSSTHLNMPPCYAANLQTAPAPLAHATPCKTNPITPAPTRYAKQLPLALIANNVNLKCQFVFQYTYNGCTPSFWTEACMDINIVSIPYTVCQKYAHAINGARYGLAPSSAQYGWQRYICLSPYVQLSNLCCAFPLQFYKQWYPYLYMGQKWLPFAKVINFSCRALQMRNARGQYNLRLQEWCAVLYLNKAYSALSKHLHVCHSDLCML